MAPKGETEVLVVGAGPVGLFTALLLADQGVRVRIVDEEFRTAAHSYALALHPGSLQLLDQAGVTADLLRQGHRVETVAFYEGSQRRGEMKLAKLGGDFPYVLVMPQSVLEGLLERRLRERGVKVQWNHRVTALQPEESYTVARIDKLAKAPCGYAVATMEWVTEKTLETAAPFVVGADGHRSIVRHTLGIDYEPVGPAASFAVFEFHSDADLASEVRIVLGEQTTDVLWQMLGGRFRWSFQLADRDVSAETRLKRRLTVPIGRQVYPHLSSEDLTTLIEARAPWFEGEVRQIDWSMEVRFERRLAERFGRHRCWLAGDAAHLTGPVGGQSLNMGLREAADLSARLTEILRKNAPLDSLGQYGREYAVQWRHLLGIDEGLTPTEGAQPWASRYCSRILPCIPATGDDLKTLAAQIALDFAPGERSPDGP